MLLLIYLDSKKGFEPSFLKSKSRKILYQREREREDLDVWFIAYILSIP